MRRSPGRNHAAPDTTIIAKANAGIPKYVDGHIHYDGTPELMARYAILARNSGAKIIGGCCGTMPEHLRAMRKALESTPKGDAPTLEQIVAEIGPFSSDSDGTGDVCSDFDGDGAFDITVSGGGTSQLISNTGSADTTINGVYFDQGYDNDYAHSLWVTVYFTLLAVPFFILVGTIMNHAGITRRLLVLAEALVGHEPR